MFVDTSAWYPVVRASVVGHVEVTGALREAVGAGRRLVTTNLVIAETHALLMWRAGRRTALEFARTVREPPNLVVCSTFELEERATDEWLEAYDDQDFSFTDAVSFAVMNERGIDLALALDSHFVVAGFEVMPGVVGQ